MAIKKGNKKEELKLKEVKNVNEELTFNDDDVDALDPLEAIRLRYDMYAGSLDPVTHMVKELFDNSIDEFTNNFCKNIWIKIDTKKNSITVKDDGRGLPHGINAKLKQPTIQVLFTHVHAGSKYDKKSVKVSAGKNGVGLKIITACSEFAHVESLREGAIASMEFSRGKITQEFKTKKTKEKGNGTTVTFIPDASLFGEEDVKLKPEKIREEINLKCYLNAGLKVTFIVDGEEEVIQYNLGLSDFLNTEVESPLFNMENIVFENTDNNGNTYEVALAFQNSTDEKILSFVNSLPTLRGTHETGFKKGITIAFNEYIKNNGLLAKKDSKLQIKGEDIRRGLVAIISLKHVEPMFDGQTKSELTNKDVDSIVKNIVSNNITRWFEENPQLAKKLCERAVAFARATNNAKESMKKIVKVSASSMGLTVTEKFKDCISEDPNEVEIIIIEGDSAAGNVEQGRFADFQCVYPLKGKIKNTYKSKHNTIINTAELNEFLKIMFGTNDINKIRAMFASGEIDKVIKGKKIIIMTDADPDGNHIQNLFINFIYEHLPEIIELGYLYIGVSPFYRVNVNGKWRYFMNDYEYNQFVSEIISKKYKVKEKGWTVSKVLMKADDYISEFDRIKNKFSIDNEIINVCMRQNEVDGMIKEFQDFGLEVYDIGNDDYQIEGLFENIWHSFFLSELFAEMEKSLVDIYPFSTINMTEDGELFEFDLYNGLTSMKKAFKYSRNRIKGLGELDGIELRETSLDPNTRTLIQVKADKSETEEDLFKVLFGPNPDLRKNFIGKHLL